MRLLNFHSCADSSFTARKSRYTWTSDTLRIDTRTRRNCAIYLSPPFQRNLLNNLKCGSSGDPLSQNLKQLILYPS